MNIDQLPDIDIDVDSAAAAAPSGVVLLDVREDYEWMSGHVPNAMHIPMSELMVRVGELDNTKQIICACRSGNRSARVTAWLRQHGFDAVNLTGGMSAWSSFGHPLVNHAGNPGVVI